VPTLWVEMTWARVAANAVEADHVATILVVETSAQEAAVAWDSATLRVKDADDRSTMAEREALKRVSRAEVESVMALAPVREDVEAFARKIVILVDELAAECRARER
jgi:hypothetical protein